jgi:hypothetical protein
MNMLKFGKKVVILSIIILGCIHYPVQAESSAAIHESSGGVIRVAPSGSDVSGCGSVDTPCRSIQYAVNSAASGDTILVAAGTYTYPAVGQLHSDCYLYTTTEHPPVVCIRDKHLTMRGGYSTSDWSTADPVANPTIIDGQNQHRGISLTGSRTTEARASLHLEGFTVQNGLAQGYSFGTTYETRGHGGGMLAVRAPIEIENVRFVSNKAIGGNTSENGGGAGVGGGLAINRGPDGTVSTLENVIFENNEARGGTGPVRGGSALGGGFLTYYAVVEGSHITLTNNVARGGDSDGLGVYVWSADALGGGAAIHVDSVATLAHVTATGNQAIGGNAGTMSEALAGAGHGGALYTELGTMNVIDSDLRDNLALGGDAANGFIGGGGAVMSGNSNVYIARTTIVNNTARGGNGTTGHNGAAGGGGVYLARFSGNTSVSIVNSVIADNLVEQGTSGSWSGGGGGGLWLQGLEVDIVRTTIAGNRLGCGLQGQGALFVHYGCNTPTVANVSHSIIADHTAPGTAALRTVESNTVNLSHSLLVNNAIDTRGDGVFNISNMYTAASAGFIASGAPNYNYHLLMDSEAANRATTTPATDFDLDKQPPVYSGVSDLGADEYWPFALTAAPGDGSLSFDWSQEAYILAGGVAQYRLNLTCEAGAADPNELDCGGSKTLSGSTTSFKLTGLTNFKGYTVQIDARNASNATIAQSKTTTAYPTDIFVYLPLVLKN